MPCNVAAAAAVGGETREVFNGDKKTKNKINKLRKFTQ